MQWVSMAKSSSQVNSQLIHFHTEGNVAITLMHSETKQTCRNETIILYKPNSGPFLTCLVRKS